MENNQQLSKFSAYNRVCQRFLESCAEEKVDPSECLLAISRFIAPDLVKSGPSPTVPGSVAKQQPPNSAESRRLTKEEAEAAKRLAREAKARDLGLKASEVNLTPKEAKEAKAEARKKLASGIPVHASPKSEVKVGTAQVASSPPPSSQKKVEKATNAVPQMKTGLRATALTKLKSCRKICLQAFPPALREPKVIHLVAYQNHFRRLVSQWTEFCAAYEQHGISNPLRGLLDPSALEHSRGLLQRATQNLVEQADTPGIYILQDQGKSFWDRDMPSEACPYVLREDLPKEVLSEFTLAQSRNG